MILYRKEMRAIAQEVGDSHFQMKRKEYPWYTEQDFPTDMEERVKKDNPFGGWYKYEVEEQYIRW